MKTVKFVGGPFHGTEHEVADDIVELRLPVLKDSKGNVNYLRYTQPKADEFVYNGRDIGDIEPTPVLTKPEQFISYHYIFNLIKLGNTEFSGPPREPDTCDYKIWVRNKNSPDDSQFVTTVKIWQWYDHHSVELVKEHKWDVSFIDSKNNKFDADFIYGLAKILEQNGFTR